MEALRTHVAGVDVHKEVLAITVLIEDKEGSVQEIQFNSKTFTEDLIKCGRRFLDLGVKEVAMESTGVYWKPLYNVWHPMGIKLTIGQAAHIKNVPGRKTDMNDSEWIARLHRYGLIRASLIPQGEFQRIRLFSRHRTHLIGDLNRVKNRIQKTLEDGNIKWGTIVSNVFGKSGLKILRLLADGVTDAVTLSLAVTTRIKRKDEIRKSLTNCFTKEHCLLLSELMEQYDHIQVKISKADEQLGKMVKPYRHLIDELKKIPGIDEVLAQGILSEATNDMSHFANERSFAAWAGVAPGNNESAGKKKRSKCRPGNPYLRKLLVQAAHGAVRKKRSFFFSKFNKLKFRLGSANKAKVAIANRMARSLYYILGGDNYIELSYSKAIQNQMTERKVKNLLAQLKLLGVSCRLEKHELIATNTTKVTTDGVALSQ